jgi:hypothetical protein
MVIFILPMLIHMLSVVSSKYTDLALQLTWKPTWPGVKVAEHKMKISKLRF